jgi:hypothetical protein
MAQTSDGRERGSWRVVDGRGGLDRVRPWPGRVAGRERGQGTRPVDVPAKLRPAREGQAGLAFPSMAHSSYRCERRSWGAGCCPPIARPSYGPRERAKPTSVDGPVELLASREGLMDGWPPSVDALRREKGSWSAASPSVNGLAEFQVAEGRSPSFDDLAKSRAVRVCFVERASPIRRQPGRVRDPN